MRDISLIAQTDLKSGGGGGNRTRVRSRAALATTCVVSENQP